MEELIARAQDILRNPDAWDDPVAELDALAEQAGPQAAAEFAMLGEGLFLAMEESARHRSQDAAP